MTRSIEATCKTVRESLVEVCSREAAPDLLAHLDSCPACAAIVRDADELGRSLAELPPVALPTGFEARLRSRLLAVAPARRAPARPVYQPWLRAGLAFAAGLAVVGGLWLGRPVRPSVDAAERELVAMDVEVEAAVATPGVAVEITLPRGLALESDDEGLASLHTLAWTTDLEAGVNRFSVVLRADERGNHTVHVTLSADGHKAAVDLAVHVRPQAEHASFAPLMRAVFAAGPKVRLSLGGDS